MPGWLPDAPCCKADITYTCSLRIIGRSPHLEPLQLHILAKRLVVHRLRTPPQLQRSAGLLSSTYIPVQRSFACPCMHTRLLGCRPAYARTLGGACGVTRGLGSTRGVATDLTPLICHPWTLDFERVRCRNLHEKAQAEL